jgi:nucleoside-diphosphate-sugar epimerase
MQALTVNGVEGEVFNVASGKSVSIHTMIEKICALTGHGKPRFGEVPYRHGENMALYGDINKIRSKLEWEPKISLDNGLKKTISSIEEYHV